MEAQTRVAELEAELIAKDRELAAKDRELAARDARIQELETMVEGLTKQVAALVKRVEELTAHANRNSRNSNLPPSGDPPGKKGRGGGKGGTGRKRGGQPGHRGHHRELVPADQVDEVVDLFPKECEDCYRPLAEIPDPSPKRYQQVELPVVEPEIIEYRRHTVRCDCGHDTCATYDPAVIPVSSFGPRLMSVVALLTAVYHLSRRQTVRLLGDLLGMDISLGAVSAIESRVSEAVVPAVDEAWTKVLAAPVKHTDGTGWLQSNTLLALWTIATTAATVFKVMARGTKELLKPLFGELQGILVSDRAGALTFWAMELRQICWAHLLRKFVSFSERDGLAKEIGCQLLDYTGILFQYWHDHREGKMSRATLRAWMLPLREQVEALLEKAIAAEIDGVSGSCRDILEHKAALWNFIDCEGVEPTNNHAERELRGFVLWRRRCFGSQSERGTLFAERLMTVAHTARKQNRHVLNFLTASCRAHVEGTPTPSLFSAAA